VGRCADPAVVYLAPCGSVARTVTRTVTRLAGLRVVADGVRCRCPGRALMLAVQVLLGVPLLANAALTSLWPEVIHLGWARRPADFSRVSAHFPSAMPGYARQPGCINPGEDAPGQRRPRQRPATTRSPRHFHATATVPSG
jgi:hypothetical protein